MKLANRRPPTIIEAARDPNIWAEWFKDVESWSAWFVFLKIVFALPLDAAELATFQKHTGRTAPATDGYLEATLICGRRAGKSFILALIAAFLVAFRDWSPYLTGGERATGIIVAADRKQARSIFRYLKEMLSIPLLQGLIGRETQDVLELTNGVNVEIVTASFKTIRSRTICAALLDEEAFWPVDEGMANPDIEVVNAIRPSTATVPGAMLLKASSPYARRGDLYDDFRRYYGNDDAPVLVWKASTRSMNPTVPESFIAAAYERDAANAAAEYGAEFRSDIESFVRREAVERCVIADRIELPPMASARYVAFCDPSGGSSDSMTLAIAHREKDRAVLDVIREIRPPSSPEQVVEEFCALLKMYRIGTVIGDRYAGEWPRERFQAHGVTYQPSAKPKSDLYIDLLPGVNGARIELLDHPRLIQQLCSLERRTARSGRDSIDHPPNQHDDVVNAAAGALTALIAVKPPQPCFGHYWAGRVHIYDKSEMFHREMDALNAQLGNRTK